MYDYNSLMGVDFSMDKKTRILTRQSGSAHATSLVAWMLMRTATHEMGIREQLGSASRTQRLPHLHRQMV
ncbi:MAG: hypothetical protein ACLU4N_25600 [Butyricimonas faecihominis]